MGARALEVGVQHNLTGHPGKNVVNLRGASSATFELDLADVSIAGKDPETLLAPFAEVGVRVLPASTHG